MAILRNTQSLQHGLIEPLRKISLRESLLELNKNLKVKWQLIIPNNIPEQRVILESEVREVLKDGKPSV